MIDEAGGRIGWDVVALTSFDADEFRSIAETFASATESRSREYRLGRHNLAVVAWERRQKASFFRPETLAAAPYRVWASRCFWAGLPTDGS